MDLVLTIILIAIALVIGIIIGIIIANVRFAKNVPYAGEILVDWTIADPSNISIQNGKDILHWHEKKRLMFNVVNTRHKPKLL